MVLPLQFFHQLEGLDNKIRVFQRPPTVSLSGSPNAVTLLPAPRFGIAAQSDLCI
jgi:hypothetical protein